MNKPLSERIQALITIYTTKVTSMDEAAQSCINYNYMISDLYVKLNYIKRLEGQEKAFGADYEKHKTFIEMVEFETDKIIQEELLIKRLTDEQNIQNQISESNSGNGQKMIFETSDHTLIEVDASMSDVIIGGFIIDKKPTKDKDKEKNKDKE